MTNPEHISELLDRLRRLDKRQLDLTDDEIQALRDLVLYAPDIADYFRYRRARTLLIREWRATIVFVAAGVGAVVALRQDAKDILAGLIEWASKK